MAALMVFIVFLIAIAVSVPIGVAMCLGTLFPQYFMNAGAPVDQLINFTLSGADSTPILAVPLFILGGVIMAEGGISRRLFNFFSYFVGNIPGGVPCAAILTCLFYGAISGSGPATTAAVGSMCIPFMVEMGYEKRWSAGLIAVAGGLGVIIPPSIPFVLYSLATGVSTGDLFLAGVIPGILIGLFMMAYAVIFCITKGEDKQRIRAKMSELRGNGFLKLFADSFFALLCPIIVLGGIYSGIVTPTEAACVSVFYALFVSLVVYRSITLKDLIPFLASSVKTYGGLAFVLGLILLFTLRGEAISFVGFVLIGLALICWSISSKVILLAKIWHADFPLANRIPIIPVLTALACLFLAAFLYEAALSEPKYFVPARVLTGFGAICFTLYSIVSILESGASKK